MKTTRRFSVVVVFAACAIASATASAARPYRNAPPAAWVDQVSDTELLAAERKPVDAGEDDFLLVDNQVRLSSITEKYSRYVEHLANQAAADRGAQISVDLDPERERVLLHGVRVVRDGKIIDKLADARVSLLNREEGLEQGLIDGRVTLHILLQDVRLGDVLDYSYTEERRDPPADRKFQEWFRTQWATPVRHQRVRLLSEAGRTVHVKDLGAFGEPRRRDDAGWRELVWDKRDVAALREEAERPSWHLRYPRIEFSEFGSWSAVREWAQPWYDAAAAGGSAELTALAADIRGEPDESARIVRALRFVQDDVRYTGLEIGDGALRPTAPATVLARRYGDCKDKVLLLIALLRELGVEARPALVHSRLGRGVAERLPSIGAFDHVIARVRANGRVYWFDATSSGQGGALDSIVQADFGRALVLAPGVSALEVIPERDAKTPTTQLVETYDLRKGVTATATLRVKTTYRDGAADGMRVRMRSTTAANLGKEYLEFYRRSHRGIRQVDAPLIADDRNANRLVVDEHYAIDEPFEKNDEGLQFFTTASLIVENSREPDETVRTTPLSRNFPLNVRHEIVVMLPKDWGIDEDKVEVDDPAFRYRSSVSFKNQRLRLVHELHNLRDHVPADQLDDFLVNLEKVRDDAYFTLTDSSDGKEAAAGGQGPNYALIMTFIVGLGVGGLLAAGVRRSRWRLPGPEADAPAGLGGWLILPLIGTVLSPFLVLYSTWTWFNGFGGAATFQALATSVQSLVVVEVLLLGAVFVLSIYTLVVLLQRRREFPWAFIAVEVLAFATLVVDTTVLHELGDDARKEFVVQIAQVIGNAGSAALWITYMFVSQRVRATFVQPWEPYTAPGPVASAAP